VVLVAVPEEREGRDNRPTTLIQGYSSTLLPTSKRLQQDSSHPIIMLAQYYSFFVVVVVVFVVG
jgi:hypothetical protein